MVKKLVCLSVAICLVQAVYANRSGVAAGAESISVKRLEPLHIEQGAAYAALGEISQKAHVAIGVEAIQPNEEPTIIIEFPGGTVADLLNAFIAQAPDYEWEENNGAIHVFRKNARVSLVDVQMHYPGASRKTRHEIWNDLAKRPEISTWLNSAHCTRQEYFQSREFKDNNDPISIAAGDRTLKQLLDEVAIKSGDNYWAVLQAPPSRGSCHIAIILW